jgi:hypothetical protein
MGYIRNPLGSITYLLNPRRVLQRYTRTYKGSNILVKEIYKHHGLNYIGLGFWRGIA